MQDTFWNNLHKVHSESNNWKVKWYKSLREQLWVWKQINFI